MNITEQVYWQTTTAMPGGENLAELPDRVDVAVIGGGIPGLAAARQLGRRGVRGALLEAETPAWQMPSWMERCASCPTPPTTSPARRWGCTTASPGSCR